ncbi:MAG: DUF72 domain-containing protein [Pseudomonadota bacterium]
MKKNQTSLLRIGTAGWNIPSALASAFPAQGQHLARYAAEMNAVEINSSFYRSHQQKTYARWASVSPPDFRFAVKLPRSISHFSKLQNVAQPLGQFLDEIAGLEGKLGPILVQLPPSLTFDTTVAGDFFGMLREQHSTAVVCEPRHASWFEPEAQIVLVAHHIGQVAADPVKNAAAARPGGWIGRSKAGRGSTVYLRLHGSPRMYWSSYEHNQLRKWREQLAEYHEAEAWCIFDNTAAGAALQNALEFKSMG